MITEDLLEFLNRYAEEMELPTVMLDMIATDKSVALQTITQPKVEKSYIDGTRISRYSFRLTIKDKVNQTNSLANIRMLQYLEAFSVLFDGMEEIKISPDIEVVEAEVSTPSILVREENGMVVYGFTVNMTYKE